ncbi:MAG: hypothetical protein JO172_02135 [Hyphomicrobiales bacterium]|nr:hypothetical protein [Hyphomicrobiales bacterium]
MSYKPTTNLAGVGFMSLQFSRVGFLAAFLAGAAAMPGPNSALAESATSEGAKALAQSLTPYFGQSALERGLITVVPKGEGYELGFDLQGIVDGFGLPKGALQIETFSLRAAPLGDGTWKVTSDSFPKFAFEIPTSEGDIGASVSSSSRMLDGVYDPKLAAFLSFTDKIAAFDIKMHAPDFDVMASVSGADVRSQNLGLADGSVSGKLQETFRRVQETVRRRPTVNAGDSSSAPITVSYDVGPITYDASVESARTREFLDLLAFFVAHRGEQEMIAHQDELKSKILSAFPLFKRIDVTAKVENAALDTPEGRIGAKSVVQTLHQTGLVERASTEFGVTIDGLRMPSGLIPSWAMPLVPTSLDVDVKLQMNDLDKIAHAALASFDLRPDHAPDPAKTMDLLGMAMGSEPKLSVAPGHLSSPDLELYFRGEMTFVPKPMGTLTLEAEGLDKALARLQGAAKNDPDLQRAALGLTLAKGLAKPGGNGRSVWLIAYGSDGALTVNGQRMGAPKK